MLLKVLEGPYSQEKYEEIIKNLKKNQLTVADCISVSMQKNRNRHKGRQHYPKNHPLHDTTHPSDEKRYEFAQRIERLRETEQLFQKEQSSSETV